MSAEAKATLGKVDQRLDPDATVLGIERGSFVKAYGEFPETAVFNAKTTGAE